MRAIGFITAAGPDIDLVAPKGSLIRATDVSEETGLAFPHGAVPGDRSSASSSTSEPLASVAGAPGCCRPWLPGVFTMNCVHRDHSVSLSRDQTR